MDNLFSALLFCFIPWPECTNQREEKNMKKYLFLLKRFFFQPFIYVLFGLMFITFVFFKGLNVGDGQLARIGLLLEKDSDSTAKAFCSTLLEEESDFDFTVYETYDLALEELQEEKLDELWIIPRNLSDTIDSFVNKKSSASKIEIIVLENDIRHLFLREVLFSKLMPFISPALCKTYIKEISGTDEIEIYGNPFTEVFNQNIPPADLFIGNNSSMPLVLLPFRGLLGLLLFVITFGISFNYILDERKGLFIFWKTRFITLRAFLYYFVLLIIPALVVQIFLFLSDSDYGFIKEICSMLLYLCSLIIFANILRLLFSSCKSLGIVMPLIVFLCLFVTPIFIFVPVILLLKGNGRSKIFVLRACLLSFWTWFNDSA